MQRPIGIIIVDDYDFVRQALRLFLQLDKHFVILGEGSTGQEAIDLVFQLAPDVVFMDMQMPVMDGLTATFKIHEQQPQVSVIILSSQGDAGSLQAAQEAGAKGFLVKGSSPTQLIEAAHAVTRGDTFFSIHS